MQSAWSLLVLVLAAASEGVVAWSSYSGSFDLIYSINFATIVAASDVLPQENSSSLAYSSSGPVSGESIDFLLMGNTSMINETLGDPVGYATAADNWVTYLSTSWTLVEDGTEEGKLSTFWARFEALNPTPKFASQLSVCTMVAEWNSSWPETKAALYAVEVQNRLQNSCNENDSIAIAFTEAVYDAAAAYLKGEVAVNDAVAPVKLHDVGSSELASVTSPSVDRMFVRLTDGLCPRDESAQRLHQESASDAPLVSLFSGILCDHGPKDPHGPSVDSDSHNDSDWKRDLRFIIPVAIVVFLLGCGGLYYVFRQKKTDTAAKDSASNSETPKAEEKDDASSMPYVLTMHAV
ncbi:unnamed protein product [Phytophthora lilii]|uniref:Unnamed protein product n=1 Tax=Phytophthora lilii TaxID=2077276 RepID=A0A9W6WPF7_9STRA|nr:unnamed protein product [Phytophthora lilii]